MKFLKVLPLIWLLASGAQARLGGSDAGNGGGLAEKRLLFAYQNLEKYFDLCLEASLCKLNDQEIRLLQDLRGSLPEERKNPRPLEFQSGKAAPGSFKIDGEVRVARTGDAVGGTIFINTDLLYWSGSGGRSQSVDLPTAVSILTHELGHHHGVKDHLFLDQLGTKIQTALLKQVSVSDLWNGDVELTVVHNTVVVRDEDKKKIQDIDQWLVAHDDQLLNATPKLLAGIHCPDPRQSVKGLRLYNFHEERGIHRNERTGFYEKPLRAWYVLSCRAGEETDHGDLAITLALRRTGHGTGTEVSLELSSVQQQSCARVPAVCR
jgi:hypothetical protein